MLRLLIPLALLARAADWDARLTAVEGQVVVLPAGEAVAIPAKTGYPLRTGDRITTGFGGSCEVALDAGRLIVLRPESEFVLRSLEYSSSEVWLGVGSLLARIKPLLEGQRLSVRTPAAVAAVRGTKLAVESAKDEPKTYVGVFDEGRLEVEGETGETVALELNQETFVAKGASPAPPAKLKRFARLADSMADVTSRAKYVNEHWRPYGDEQRAKLRREAEAVPGDLRSVPRQRPPR